VNTSLGADEIQAVSEGNSHAVPDSIPMEKTKLHAILLEDGHHLVTIDVPEGIDEESRAAQLALHNRTWEVEIPTGSKVGDEVSVWIPVVPPLDPVALLQIWHELRWPLRWTKEESPNGEESWVCDEERLRMRIQNFKLMQGRSMYPSLRAIPENSD